MFCAISGQTPEEPVVSKVTGHLFEKRLIEKFIQSEAKCPVTGQPLTNDDLIPVNTTKSVKPRPVAATSIPGMLAMFQNEWDALMLETFQLKQHLDTVRQELSHALYQHDAACRVIARLIKERDSAQSVLTNAEQQMAAAAASRETSSAAAGAEPMETEEAGMSAAVLKKLTTTSQMLSKSRKKRVIPTTLASAQELAGMESTSSGVLHKANNPGVLCLDLHPSNQDLVLTGGADNTALLYNHAQKKAVATMSGHGKKVVRAEFHPTEEAFITCSADKTARVWRKSGDAYASSATLVGHTGEVSSCNVHPTAEYVVTGSLDKTWAFWSLATGARLALVEDKAVEQGYSSVRFHPDGLILGTGTVDSLVRVWDIKTQANVATFEGHKGMVTDIAFSENGYYLATSAQDSTVKLWDLRKLKNFHTIEMEGAKVNALHFDYSGSYLAVGGSDVRIYASKSWNLLKTFDDHKATVTGVKFGQDARLLVSGSMDRTVKFYK